MPNSREPGFFKEEFDRLFGYGKDELGGVRDWKISTLGPTKVGKTVLISGLYAQFYLGTVHGRDIGIESIGTALHDMLESVAKGLRRTPAWVPERTDEIHNARLKFLVKGERRQYQKIFDLQDHPGEHLLRSSPEHSKTLESLKSSDTFLVFVDSRELFRDDYYEAAENMEFAVITDIIRSVTDELHEEDLIPISVVLSKSDLIKGREEEALKKMESLMKGLSEELSECVFCFSTASVLKSAQSNASDKLVFAPRNIEVPFLFSIAGIVLRNANFLRIAAEEVAELRDEIKSQEINARGFFKRIVASVQKGMEVRRLDSRSKRYFSLSSYDIEMARSAIKVVKVKKNVTYMKSGEIYNDVEDVLLGLL